MPFWGKKRPLNDPQATPKLSSIALPDELPPRSASTIPGQWGDDFISKTKSADSRLARSRTPYPTPSKPSPETASNERPRTASMTKTTDGYLIKGILKTSKQVEESNDKEASRSKDSYEATKSHHTRERTISSSSVALKGILKPSKPRLDDDVFNKPIIPILPNKRGGSPDLIEDPFVYRKSAMKGGHGDSYPSSKEKDQEKTSYAAYPERYGQASQFYQVSPVAPQPRKPMITHRAEYRQDSGHRARLSKLYPDQTGIVADEYYSESEVQRSRSHSTRPRHAPTPLPSSRQAPSHSIRPLMYPLDRAAHNQGPAYSLRTGHGVPRYDHLQALEQHHQPAVQNFSGQTPPNSKYVKPVVVRSAPQKGEEISLSWPFIDPAGKSDKHQRHQYPKLFYDVGMDPWADTVGVRAYLHGCAYTRPLVDNELYLPASSHCILKRMTIMCEYMERWPVVAERAEGLRCIDVFEAIYKNYSIPLTAEERASYTREFLESCIPAFKQRCIDGPGLTSHNEAKGLCRVDVLRTKKIFRGIEKKSRNSAWILTLDRPREATTL